MSQSLPEMIVTDDYESMSRVAAAAVLEMVHTKPEALVCVATGASPAGVYACLAQHRASLGQVRVLKLDEWGGLAPDDPATCEVYIRQHVLEPWGVPRERYLGFISDAPDPQAECERVARVIALAGGIDVCILGMGADGHIGLNYPAAELPPGPHPTDASTLRHAMLDAACGVPTHGLTLGMADVLRSRRIVLVVNGESKAAAVQRLGSGGLSTGFPASLLWLHPDVTCVLDRAAARGLVR
jgi:galactosamine-6-phosphate isomerase